jgi:hypothetical protein
MSIEAARVTTREEGRVQRTPPSGQTMHFGSAEAAATNHTPSHTIAHHAMRHQKIGPTIEERTAPDTGHRMAAALGKGRWVQQPAVYIPYPIPNNTKPPPRDARHSLMLMKSGGEPQTQSSGLAVPLTMRVVGCLAQPRSAKQATCQCQGQGETQAWKGGGVKSTTTHGRTR